MAKQAEAERGRRANIINADGERAAAETLAEAARILAGTRRSDQPTYVKYVRAYLNRTQPKDDDALSD